MFHVRRTLQDFILEQCEQADTYDILSFFKVDQQNIHLNKLLQDSTQISLCEHFRGRYTSCS